MPSTLPKYKTQHPESPPRARQPSLARGQNGKPLPSVARKRWKACRRHYKAVCLWARRVNLRAVPLFCEMCGEQVTVYIRGPKQSIHVLHPGALLLGLVVWLCDLGFGHGSGRFFADGHPKKTSSRVTPDL